VGVEAGGPADQGGLLVPLGPHRSALGFSGDRRGPALDLLPEDPTLGEPRPRVVLQVDQRMDRVDQQERRHQRAGRRAEPARAQEPPGGPRQEQADPDPRRRRPVRLRGRRDRRDQEAGEDGDAGREQHPVDPIPGAPRGPGDRDPGDRGERPDDPRLVDRPHDRPPQRRRVRVGEAEVEREPHGHEVVCRVPREVRREQGQRDGEPDPRVAGASLERVGGEDQQRKQDHAGVLRQ
jgi:hypothetical protein